MIPSEADYAHAVELLRAGELVALPTETVYGLAANALVAFEALVGIVGFAIATGLAGLDTILNGLRLGDNVGDGNPSSLWAGFLARASDQWSKSQVLNTVVVDGKDLSNLRKCRTEFSGGFLQRFQPSPP